jgi:hypothetical protein
MSSGGVPLAKKKVHLLVYLIHAMLYVLSFVWRSPTHQPNEVPLKVLLTGQINLMDLGGLHLLL